MAESFNRQKFIIVVVVVCSILAVITGNVGLYLVGFRSGGVAANSYAKKLMSDAAKANNGSVPKGHYVAALQRFGVKGLGWWNAVLAIVGAVVGFLAALPLVLIFEAYTRIKGFLMQTSTGANIIVDDRVETNGHVQRIKDWFLRMCAKKALWWILGGVFTSVIIPVTTQYVYWWLSN